MCVYIYIFFVQRDLYGVLPIRFFLNFGISIFEFTLNFDPIHGVCNPLERRDGGQQILPKSQIVPSSQLQKPRDGIQTRGPKTELGRSHKQLHMGMGRACHSHKNARTKGPSPPSISRPTWPPSPTPLPLVPDSPLFPKLPCGRPQNPQWRRLPWRRARALAPRQGHTPHKKQCMASISSAQPFTNVIHFCKSAMHFLSKCNAHL